MIDLDWLLSAGQELRGSLDGRLLHRTPGDPYWYHTGLPDASPETSAAIRRIDAALAETDPEETP